jgi:hypothetical protein
MPPKKGASHALAAFHHAVAIGDLESVKNFTMVLSPTTLERHGIGRIPRLQRPGAKAPASWVDTKGLARQGAERKPGHQRIAVNTQDEVIPRIHQC